MPPTAIIPSPPLPSSSRDSSATPATPDKSIRVGRFEFFDGVETHPKDSTVLWLQNNRVQQRLIGNFGFANAHAQPRRHRRPLRLRLLGPDRHGRPRRSGRLQHERQSRAQRRRAVPRLHPHRRTRPHHRPRLRHRLSRRPHRHHQNGQPPPRRSRQPTTRTSASAPMAATSSPPSPPVPAHSTLSSGARCRTATGAS